MQTDRTDRIQAEIASQPKQVANTLDPDIQTLILEWVVPCLIDDFLSRHHELTFERQMQPVDTDLTPVIGVDGLQSGLWL
jgi:hypothetical protein